MQDYLKGIVIFYVWASYFYFKICLLPVFISCPSPLWAWIPPRTLKSFIWACYPASLRNVRGSTLVPARNWNNTQMGIWGLPPPINTGKLRYERYCVGMFYETSSKSHLDFGTTTKAIWHLICWCDF